jgi:flagellar biosynthesis protein FlhF
MASRPLAGLSQGIRDLVEERLLPCRAPWLHGDRHVVALVGPTGVGKTTTLAKIAARAILETRKKVALLSVDVYRIGAQEQLARYGEIMNVPVLVARDRAELGRAAERVRDADLVLVDTAGRSSPEDVARQADLVRTLPGVLLHLVVSAAAGPQQLAAVGDAWRALRPDRLVFTKLDEAVGPGAILSAAVRVGRPTACIADGQRVPEDLHAATGRQLVELVTGPADAPPAPRAHV